MCIFVQFKILDINKISLYLSQESYGSTNNNVTFFLLQIAIPEHKLQLWPGYYTSMRQHEQNILLNCDMKFKIMRIDNVYDLLLECQSSASRQEFQSKIIGSIVLTNYNNKTYRVDDVDFNSSPLSTFNKKDGTKISYIDYYKQRYNLKIQVKIPCLI